MVFAMADQWEGWTAGPMEHPTVVWLAARLDATWGAPKAALSVVNSVASSGGSWAALMAA